MINYIFCKDSKRGEADLAKVIAGDLGKGKRVIWLLPGGSNVPISVSVLRLLRVRLSEKGLKNLVIMQVDERYGPVGHPDSNWTGLMKLGFPVLGIRNFPILKNISLRETTDDYSRIIDQQFEEADSIIGQFGMGSDGHIAGLMPKSEGFKCTKSVCGYEHGGSHTRISLGIEALLKINQAFVFVFGRNKGEAIQRLHNNRESIENLPAALFNMLPEVQFYTDNV